MKKFKAWGLEVRGKGAPLFNKFHELVILKTEKRAKEVASIYAESSLNNIKFSVVELEIRKVKSKKRVK